MATMPDGDDGDDVVADEDDVDGKSEEREVAP